MQQSSLKAAYYITPEHLCSYLSYEMAQMIFIDPELEIDKQVVSFLSREGFRRSGDFIYRPHCPDCRQCVSCRIVVDAFKPTSIQKKALKKNQTTTVKIINPAHIDAPVFDLYTRYIEDRHSDGDMFPATAEQFEKFILEPQVFTFYIGFYSEHQLIGVSVCDRLDDGISAVYTFYDPLYDKQSIGTFAILTQINIAKLLQLPYVYLGYWVKDSAKMRYKTNFEPLELYRNNRWNRYIPILER